MSDLASTALLLEAVIADLDELMPTATVDDLAAAMVVRSILATTAMGLSSVRESLDDKIGEAMGEYRKIVEGFGQVERHKKKSRTKWDTDDLRRAVLDSRVIDEATGEVLDPNPVDKILRVWNLGAPRLTALRERGLDPDEFAVTEERSGWQLKVS